MYAGKQLEKIERENERKIIEDHAAKQREERQRQNKRRKKNKKISTNHAGKESQRLNKKKQTGERLTYTEKRIEESRAEWSGIERQKKILSKR